VFSRPIRRWEFLLGKWIGIQSFAILSLALGLLASFGVARYLGAEFEFKTLGISLVQTVVAICLYSGIAIAFSTLAGSGVAGALAILIAFLPTFVTYLVDSSNSTNHAVGVVMDYVVPPGYSSYYGATIPTTLPLDAFPLRGGRGNRRGGVPAFMAPAQEPEIDYDNESWTILQNVGYALGFFVLGCLVISRRELRLT
jgi:ABC-type transport system involved in multi-copper enzyme maturation permease subunit